MASKHAIRSIRSIVVGALLVSLLCVGSGVATASTSAVDKVPGGPTHVGLDGNVSVLGTEVIGNTGDSLLPNVDQVAGSAYAPPPGPAVNKERLLAANTPKVDKMIALYSTTSADQATATSSTMAGTDCDMPCTMRLWQPLTHQERTYSCGAASGRLVVWGYRHSDPGESTMRSHMKTSSNGTYSSNIPPALNRYATPHGDHFVVKAPGDGSTYFNMVVSDVNDWDHSLINNVFTQPLPYFSGRRLRHYNVTYGYTVYNLGYVYVAEEWDPSVFYSNWRQNYPDGNPYGYHGVPNSKMWQAISENKGLVVW